MNGCAATNHTHGDPLVGDHNKNSPAATPVAPTKTSNIKPPPTAPPSGSNASLAVNSLPGGRPLAIQEATWQRNTSPPDPSSPSPNPPSGPSAGPLVQPVPREGQNNLQTTGWAPAGAKTDSLEAMLQSRNVLNPQQENVPQGVRVSAFVRDRVTPSRLHFVESTARDIPTAVQALVQQIDQLR